MITRLMHSFVAVATGAILLLGVPSAHAEGPPSFPTSPQVVAPTPDNPSTNAVIRYCGSGWFNPWRNFAELSNNLSNSRGWYLNSNRVWQSPSDTATWELYCALTNGRATLNASPGGFVTATPSPIYLSDGTRIDFRAQASSPGYTIDINAKGTIYKVHLQR